AIPARTTVCSLPPPPPAMSRDSGRQQAEPHAGSGVDAEHVHPSPGPDAFQVEPEDDPVVGEPKCEVRIVVERNHIRSLSDAITTSGPRVRFPGPARQTRTREPAA